MKKIIGGILIFVTVLLCVIYSRVTSHRSKAEPTATFQPEPLQGYVLLTFLLLK
jgi:hypothetical protein